MTPSIHRRHLLLSLFAAVDATGAAVATPQAAAPAGSGAGSTPSAAAPAATAAANPLALKLMVLGRRKPGTTLAEHRQHIRHVHGEIVLRYIAAEPQNAPRRYAQHTVFDGQFRASAPGTDPFALNRDFVTQIWFPDFGALGRSRETAFYKEQLQGDEDNFVDQATVVFVPVRERPMAALGERPAPAGTSAVKLFVCLQRTPGSTVDAFRAAWTQATARLADLPAGAQPRRHVQNDVLSPPGPAGAKPPPLDGIDEFWFDDEAAARAALAHWQRSAEPALVAAGAIAPGSAFALFAHEAVLHAGPR